MLLFLLISGFSPQPPASLEDVIVWTFNGRILSSGAVDSAVYVNPQYCKRGWYRYANIPFNLFPLVQDIPPFLNQKGAFFEGGVQVANIQTDAGWPYDNPYDDDHLPPYKIPDPVFDDFVTLDADGNIYWISNIGGEEITMSSIANENYWTYVLFWAYQQIDANVNALEFDEITGAYKFSTSGTFGDNKNTGYDDYALGTANFATRVSLISVDDSLFWFMPEASASSEFDSAKYAFDGNLSTYWVSDTSGNHWIEVDFGRPRTVQQIYLSLYQPDILKDFDIKFWADSIWQDFTPPIQDTANTQERRSFLVEPVSTERVRLYSQDKQVYLPEFQIFGQGFRQFLLKRYYADSGWSATDPRWVTEKRVDFGDTAQCPDNTINTFNYRKYLEYHSWTGNPYGGIIDTLNFLDPLNPFFLDWFPGKYARVLILHFFADSSMRDSVRNLYLQSFSFKRLNNFWQFVCDNVRSYAQSQAKEVYITYNGSAEGLFYVDYRLKPLAGRGLFPGYPAPDSLDTLMIHIDGAQAQVNLWRMVKEWALSYGDTVPVVVFLDFGHQGNHFAHVGGHAIYGYPADERAEYLRSYPFEMYASGVHFCWPIRKPHFRAWLDTLSDGTRLIDVIKNGTDFLNLYADIYRNILLNPLENQVKVNGIVPFNGEWRYVNGGFPRVNESKVTISYMDVENEPKSYLHIINRNGDSLSHRMIPQDSVPVEIPVKDSGIMIRLISPDFAGEDTLPFTYHDGVVSLTIPDLAYYVVLILDLSSPGIEESINQNLLYQIYPNPFRGETVIKFTVNGSQFTGKNRQLLTVNCQLKIYNLAGQRVRTLVNRKQKAGSYAVKWDGRDDNKNYLSSGIYFVKLKVGDQFLQTKKMILLR